MAKLSALPQTPLSVLNVYAYLLSNVSPMKASASANDVSTPEPEIYYLSEGSYMATRATLLRTEAMILRALSFKTKVVTPYHLALTFLQTLGVVPASPTTKSRALARRTISHLNTALFSPQLLYLTHQPTAIAVAAIYLAAKETGVKLPSSEWWEVFDVEREELGFLVVGLGSCRPWMEQEKDKWAKGNCPLTVDEVELEVERSKVVGSISKPL